jgi:hypothetical protein
LKWKWKWRGWYRVTLKERAARQAKELRGQRKEDLRPVPKALVLGVKLAAKLAARLEKKVGKTMRGYKSLQFNPRGP